MASDAAVELVVSLKDQASKSLGAIAKSGGFLKDALSFATGGLIQKGIEGVTGAVTGFFADGISEAQGWNAAMAQTEAVVKSTGGAAGLSAQQMGDLAASLSGANGVSLASDDAVLAGENMLATFTNIGSTTFPRATQAMVDMAQAMGTDVKGGAIQLGKALNDPIAGIGALSRVGVTFTDQQKEQIKTMMAAGNAAGAQAVILAELEKEFGGSAAAAAKADGGMFQLSEQMANVKQTVGDALLPIMHELAGFIASPAVMGTIQSLATLIANGLTGGFTLLKNVLTVIGPPLQFLSEQIGGLIRVAWDMITTGESVGAEWQTFSPLFMGIAGTIADTILTLQQFAAVLAQAFGGELKLDTLQALPGWLQPIGALFGTIAENVGEFFRAIQGGTEPLTAIGELIKNNFLDLLPKIGELLAGIGQAIIDALPGVVAQIGTLAAAFWEWVSPQIPVVLGKLVEWSGAIGGWLIDTGLPLLGSKLIEWGGALIAWIGAAIPQAVAAIGAWAQALFDWLGTPGFQAFALQMAQYQDKLLHWIADAAVALPGKLAEWGGALLTWLQGPEFQAFAAQLAKWGGIAAQWIADAIPPMLGKLAEWLAGLVGWLITTGLPQLIGTLAGWTVKLVSWIIDSIPGLLANLGTWATELWTWITSIFTPTGTANMTAAGGDLIQGLIDGIGAMAGAVVDGIKSIWTNLSNSFTAAAGIGSPSTVFFGYGWDLINGLINALAAGKSAVITKITEIAQGALTTFQNLLGIHSDSDETISIAQFLIGGLVSGLTGGVEAVSGALAPIVAIFQQQADLTQEGTIAYWWAGAKGLIPLIAGKIDQGSASLKAYVGPAFKGVFDYVAAVFQQEVPFLVGYWQEQLNAMVAATQAAVAAIGAALASVPSLPMGGGAPAGGTVPPGAPGTPGGGGGGGGAGQISGMATMGGGASMTIWVLVPGQGPIQGQATTNASEALRWMQEMGRL